MNRELHRIANRLDQDRRRAELYLGEPARRRRDKVPIYFTGILVLIWFLVTIFLLSLVR